MRVFWFILVVTLLTGCFSKSEKEFIEGAESATQLESFKTAEVILKSGLQEYPESNRLRYLLSKLYIQTGRGDFAEGHLERLVEAGYKLEETSSLYLDALLFQSKYEDVIVAKFEPTKFADKYLFAAALSGEIEILRKLALQIDNTSYEKISEYMLAAVDQSFYKSLNTQEFFDFSLEDENQAHLVLFQAIIAERLGDYERGLSFIRQYEKYSKVNLYASILKTRLLVQAGLLNEAVKLADTLGEVAPNNNFVSYLRGYVYFSQGLYERAYLVLSNTNATGLDETSFYLMKGLSAHMEERYESAYRSLSKLKGKLPSDHPALNVLTLSELSVGDTQAAAESILSSEAWDDDGVGIMIKMLGERTIDRGTKQLLEKSALKRTKADDSSEALLARFFLANEDVEERLVKNFEDKSNSSKRAYSLIYYYLSKKQVDKAITYAEKWSSFNEADYLPFNMLGKLYQINNSLDSALASYKKSLEKEENTIGLLGVGDVLLLKNDASAARKNYIAALQIEGPAPFILKRFVLLNSMAPSPENVQPLSNAAQTYPENFEINLLYAQLLSKSGKFQKALDVLDNIEPKLADNRNIYYAEKERLLKQLLQTEQLESLYNTWLAAEPNSISAWIKAIGYFAENSRAKTIDLLSRLEKQNFKAEVKSALSSEALYKLGEYKKSLDALSGIDKNNVYYLFQTTKSHYKLEEYEQSLIQAQALYKVVESDYAALMIAQSFEKTGNKEQATSFLQQNYDKNPQHKSATFKLANLILDSDPDTSLSLLTTLNKAYPRDPFILNNLSWLLLQKGDLEEAKYKSSEALKIFPTNPYIIHTASQVSQAMGDFDLALELVNLALKISPKNEAMIATKSELINQRK